MTVISDDMRFISKQLHAELQKGHLQVDDILITTRGEIGKIALVPDSQVGSNINAQIVRINTNGKINTKYLAYFFMKNETQKVFQNAQTGSALKQLPVNKLKEILITYPKEHEQKDIATILYDMDFQIFELESKLDKLKQQKQGMMQALLTGKIRIVS
jgi:type I restriction enzyme S subunit